MSDFPSCSSESRPTARKPHQCCECRGTIQPGEIYWIFSGVWEGQGQSYKFCSDCEALRNEVDEGQLQEDLTCFGSLGESITETHDVTLLARYIAIKIKRGAKIHHSWLSYQRQLVLPSAINLPLL